MSKYIDKDRVLEYIIFGVVGKDITCGELTRAIESLPTIDIVHCRECKHYRTDISQVGGTYNGCDVWIDEGNEIEVEPNQFCSYGERIEE